MSEVGQILLDCAAGVPAATGALDAMGWMSRRYVNQVITRSNTSLFWRAIRCRNATFSASRLDAGQCRKIADRHAKGATIRELADDYEVGVATIMQATDGL
jgi:hypothetical protein